MIIEARSEHAHRVCEVIRESIKTLCVEDHHNDENILEPWLSNKTPENCKLWINSQKIESICSG